MQLINENYPYKNLIFDTHAHYDDERFCDSRDEQLSSLPDNGVCGVINNAVDCKESARACLEMSDKYPFCYSAIGVHPLNIEDNGPFSKDELVSLLKAPKVVAVGEIGLDYHYTPETREEQKALFIEQIKIANELGLPVIVHDREAHADTLEILKKYKPKGTLHCFSGSREMAEEIVKLGMYIGVGGVITFNNARKLVEVVERIPIEKILIETDAPYLAPVPYRGKTNNSAMLIEVARKIAEIKGVDTEAVIKHTTENAKQIYNIK